MDIILPLLYLAVLIVHIVLLIKTLRAPARSKWLRLILVQFLSILAAFLLMSYFDDLPGTGMMPGLTYFAEVIFSLIAAALYSTGLLCSVVLWLWKKYRHKN